ncbi:GNAT family N-acetyltransferase [Selenomonas sp. oral taxon 136]|uniref:GNAT family N-acetyltransferase n=1 Tax=Selenomonas sp. oral taxon 136 TaxID=713030 RepID=UPI000768305F|nr:GNAT family protein [Selenomonas sp. oral taxon 136]AME03132.1 GNAT family acetyltransferase [Selenomonas sp. oral taxon 136]
MRYPHLNGSMTKLREVTPAYFPYIISWRNDPANNRYLNQPYRLDMEKQRAWYEHYMADDTQGLLVVVDKEYDTPFATMGWTAYDAERHRCITGRLLVGDRRYRGSAHFAEATLLFADYVYDTLGVDVCYAHIVRENAASLRYHEKYGFHPNEGEMQFPEERIVNGMEQVEYLRRRADWCSVREAAVNRIDAARRNRRERQG